MKIKKQFTRLKSALGFKPKEEEPKSRLEKAVVAGVEAMYGKKLELFLLQAVGAFVLTVSIGVMTGKLSLNLGAVGAGEHVAVIDLDEPISGDFGIKAARALKTAAESEDAKAILIRANSPGGSPVEAEVFYAEMNRIKETTDKPIYTVVNNLCASACYYMISPSDKIYAHASSIVGSIGVILQTWNVADAIDSINVKNVTITTGKNKAALNPFQPSDEGHVDYAKHNLLEPAYEVFKGAVADARPDIKFTQEIEDGSVFLGYKAKDLKLIDEISTQLQVEEKMKKLVIGEDEAEGDGEDPEIPLIVYNSKKQSDKIAITIANKLSNALVNQLNFQ